MKANTGRILIMSLWDLLLVIVSILLAIAFSVFLVKFLVNGLITMRRSNRGGGGAFVSGLAGAMTEIDRITRPSVQYIEQVRDKILEEETVDGE
jgi:hypothetical protein